MKRTEDVFEFEASSIDRGFSLERDGLIGVRICGHYGAQITVHKDLLPDLIAALQQFQKTGTFVPPKRYVVVPSGSKPGMYLVKNTDSDKKLRRSDGFGEFLYLPESQANRIADILNEEGEE